MFVPHVTYFCADSARVTRTPLNSLIGRTRFAGPMSVQFLELLRRKVHMMSRLVVRPKNFGQAKNLSGLFSLFKFFSSPTERLKLLQSVDISMWISKSYYLFNLLSLWCPGLGWHFYSHSAGTVPCERRRQIINCYHNNLCTKVLIVY